MSSESINYFTKENLDIFLKELGKEFRKLNKTAIPAEIILIGGAAILANYGFRDSTMDVDAVIYASSAMKDAINRVGEKYNLPYGWLNADFMRTGSYSPKLDEYSVYYRTFSNVLRIRTVSAEYLIAMKLKSGRRYKNDLSDIIGILAEHEKKGNPISLEKINTAVINLYGNWDGISADSKKFIEDALNNGGYEKIYSTVNKEEKHTKNIMVEFENKYPSVVNESNINEILNLLKSKL